MKTPALHCWWPAPPQPQPVHRHAHTPTRAATTRRRRAGAVRSDAAPRQSSLSAGLQCAWHTWCAAQPASTTPSHAAGAAALHVPEAALLHALSGAGVTPLRPDLATLLAPAASWGPLHIEVPHPLGLLQLRLNPSCVRLDSHTITLADAAQQILFATTGVAHCFLVSEPGTDRHGLHWFDREGDVLARLHVSGHATTHRVMAHWLQFLAHDTNRQPAPQTTGTSPDIGRAPELTLPAHWCTIDAIVSTPAALAQLGTALELPREPAPPLRLLLQGRGVAVDYHGPVSSGPARNPSKAGTADCTPCRLVLDSGALTQAQRCTDPEGRAFVRLRGTSSGSLGIGRLGDAPAAERWLQMLWPHHT